MQHVLMKPVRVPSASGERLEPKSAPQMQAAVPKPTSAFFAADSIWVAMFGQPHDGWLAQKL